MIIYNTTFLIDNDRYESFMEWFKIQLAEKINSDTKHNAKVPRLAVVIGVAGEPEFESQAKSIAFQVEFDTIAEARCWADCVLEPVLIAYRDIFGPEALSLSTILETMI